MTHRYGLLGGLSFLLVISTTLRGQWVAFNDHAPGAGTHANTTRYHVFGNGNPASGPLRNVLSGVNLPVTLAISRGGSVAASGAVGGALASGTPLAAVFGGYVDFYGTPDPSIELSGAGAVTYTWSGLNPAKRYNLKASGVRGNSDYANRWTLCELVGAEAFTNAHSSARVLTAVQVPALAATQAALQAGVNHTANTGDYVGWGEVAPGPDGSIALVCRQYTGAVPGGASDGSKGYGLTGIRLEEFVAAAGPVTIFSHPADATLLEGQGLRLMVGASGNPIFYQWHKDDQPIGGAVAATYQVPESATNDSGRYFVVVSNQFNTLTSRVALVNVFPNLATTLVSLTGTLWRYDQSGIDRGTAWKETDYAGDTTWPLGRGVLGYENNNALVQSLTNTVLSLTSPGGARVMTYYFRTHLNFAGDPAGVSLVFSNLVDDGAAVYLNGTELYRLFLPGGALSASTPADNAPEGVFLERLIFPTNLVVGDNLLAVEVHQQSATSSDVVFGLSLQAVPVTSGPALIREGPRHASGRPGAPASFEVVAVGQTPISYQWRKDGVNIPNATNAALLLSAVSASQLGAYSVVVSNAFSVVTSSTAWLSFAELDLQVVSISRTPRFPRYQAVYTPYELSEPSGFGPYRFTAATGLGGGQTANTPRWPSLGDPVTFTATVRNRGGEEWVNSLRGGWYWDGELVREDEIPGPLPGRATTSFSLVRPWDGQSHEVRFSLAGTDARPANNTLAIDTKSVPFLSYIDESYYENFRAITPNYPQAATDDLIDWINLHMARFNRMFSEAGCVKRVHYDVLEVIPDAAPDPGIDRQPFGVFPFRFRAAEVPYSYRQSGFYNRAEDIDYGYLHEMAHQLGMIDIYQLDLSASANLVSGQGYSAVDCLMRGCSPFLSAHSALGMNQWRDVAHGYFGQYLYGIPAEVRLRLLSESGEPLRGATVRMYQLCDRPGLGKVISTQIKAMGTTDEDGQFILPNVPINPALAPPVPTGDVLRPNPFGYVAVIGNNGVLHFGVEYEGFVDYAWLDITEANVAYYQGQTNLAVFERRLALGGPVQRFPPPDLAEGNAGDWAAWAEGGAAGGTFAVNDSARRRVGATAVQFVTDGGFDTCLRYPGGFKAQWDLRGVSTLSFWCYAVNNNIGFQNGSPWIRLKDPRGSYFHYQYYQNGNLVELLNSARNVWRLFTIPVHASATEPNGWRRTLFGSPDLGRIESLEIHADTWDYGFTLWVDGVRFDPAVRPTARLEWQAADVAVMSWPASHPPLVLEEASEVTGPYQPFAYTPTESSGVVSVLLPLSADRRFFRLKVPE